MTQDAVWLWKGGKNRRSRLCFPKNRGTYQEGGKHLRITKRTNRAWPKEGWAEPWPFCQGVPMLDANTGFCLVVMFSSRWLNTSGSSAGTCLDQYPTVNESWPTITHMKSQAKMANEPTNLSQRWQEYNCTKQQNERSLQKVSNLHIQKPGSFLYGLWFYPNWGFLSFNYNANLIWGSSSLCSLGDRLLLLIPPPASWICVFELAKECKPPCLLCPFCNGSSHCSL